jgi:hypothetical protein
MAASALGTFPGPQYGAMTVAADLALAASAFAGFFGYSRPNRVDAPLSMINGHDAITAWGVGDDTAVKLSLNPNASAPFLAPDIGGPSEDPFVFSFWTSKWGYVGTFPISTTTSSLANLACIPVSPNTAFYDGTVFNPIPTAVVAVNFEAWTGSMEYRITIAATPFIRGKMAIAYTPNSSTYSDPGYGAIASSTNLCIFDIGQTTDMTFMVNWSQDLPVALLTNNSVIVPSAATGAYLGAQTITVPGPLTAAPTASNGFLTFYAIDPISAPAAVSVDVNLWARGGPDLQFFGPTNAFLYNYTTCAGHGNPTTPFSLDFINLDMAPSNACVLGGAIISTSRGGVGFMYTGEDIASFRQVFKRYVRAGSFYINTNALTGSQVNRYVFGLPSYPTIEPGFASTVYNLWAAAGAGKYYPYSNLLGLFINSFQGVRGSIRHKVYLHTLPTSSVACRTYCAPMSAPTNYSSPSVAGVGLTTPVTFAYPVPTTAAAALLILQSNNSIGQLFDGRGSDYREPPGSDSLVADVEIPYRATSNYVYNIASSSSTYANVLEGLVLDLSISYPPAVVDSGMPIGEHFISIGEDFTVVAFQGVASYTTSTTPYGSWVPTS